MSKLLLAATVDGPDQTLRSRILQRVISGTAFVTIGCVTLITILQPATFSRGMCTIAFVAALSFVVLRINQQGRTQLATMLFAGGLILLISTLAITAGGVRSPGVTMYFVVVLMVGLLASVRAGTIMALVCMTIGLGMLLTETAGLLPPGIHYNSTTIWLLSCLYMGVMVALLRVPGVMVKAALVQAETELSERRQAEQALQENRQLLRTMIENTPAAVAMFDTDMRYIAYSRRWLMDYRLGKRDLHGLCHYDVFPEIGEDWKAVHRRCMAGARESREADPFERSDGTKDFIRWVVQPWMKGSGEVGGITMFTEVITDRVQAEEERRLLREQLLEAQKLEALGTLAGGIAHDFNNILAMIGTNAELGLTETKKDGPARTSFEEIYRATDRAKEIVRQILFFGRRQDAPQEAISLLPVVEDALAVLRATLPSNVEIIEILDPNLPLIRGNASQIYQVLLNLGTNAVQAMPAGGTLTICLDLADVKIGEAAASRDLQVGRHVRIAVQDTGSGIDTEIQGRIFEPFFTTKGAKGTGLGLSVVHGLVRDHGGAIRVRSQPGHGATFQVYFPPVPHAQGNGVAVAEMSIHGHGEHILYIDDETALGSAMRRVLEQLGYRCTFCSDPRAALELFRLAPGKFDAVIADLLMPHLSGLELAGEMHAVRPDLAVAITSGNFYSAASGSTWPDNIKVRISKPATIRELGSAIALLLPRTTAQ